MFSHIFPVIEKSLHPRQGQEAPCSIDRAPDCYAFLHDVANISDLLCFQSTMFIAQTHAHGHLRELQKVSYPPQFMRLAGALV